MTRKPDQKTVPPRFEIEAIQPLYDSVADMRNTLFGMISRLDRLLPRHSSELNVALQSANGSLAEAERVLVRLTDQASRPAV